MGVVEMKFIKGKNFNEKWRYIKTEGWLKNLEKMGK